MKKLLLIYEAKRFERKLSSLLESLPRKTLLKNLRRLSLLMAGPGFRKETPSRRRLRWTPEHFKRWPPVVNCLMVIRSGQRNLHAKILPRNGKWLFLAKLPSTSSSKSMPNKWTAHMKSITFELKQALGCLTWTTKSTMR